MSYKLNDFFLFNDILQCTHEMSQVDTLIQRMHSDGSLAEVIRNLPKYSVRVEDAFRKKLEDTLVDAEMIEENLIVIRDRLTYLETFHDGSKP